MNYLPHNETHRDSYHAFWSGLRVCCEVEIVRPLRGGCPAQFRNCQWREHLRAHADACKHTRSVLWYFAHLFLYTLTTAGPQYKWLFYYEWTFCVKVKITRMVEQLLQSHSKLLKLCAVRLAKFISLSMLCYILPLLHYKAEGFDRVDTANSYFTAVVMFQIKVFHHKYIWQTSEIQRFVK